MNPLFIESSFPKAAPWSGLLNVYIKHFPLTCQLHLDNIQPSTSRGKAPTRSFQVNSIFSHVSMLLDSSSHVGLLSKPLLTSLLYDCVSLEVGAFKADSLSCF